MVADGVERRVSERVIAVERVSGWIATVALSGIILVAGVLAPLANGRVRLSLVNATAWVAITAALAWHSHRWPPVAWRHTFYRVDADGLEIRRGVYWREVINVPRSRVQHTDVSQGPLERRHGLATLVVYTAGTEHAKVTLPGLEHAIALAIRQHLLPGHDGTAV